MQRIWESILLKKFLRSDMLWGYPWVYKTKLPAYIPFLLDTWALERSQFWPRENLDRLAWARIEHTLNTAAKLPFWKEVFSKAGVQEYDKKTFLQLPVITKKEFASASSESFIDQQLVPRSKIDYTTGSTGQPLSFYHDMAYELRSFAICERMFRSAGDGKRFPVINIRGRERMGFTFNNYRFFHVKDYTALQYRFTDLIDLVRLLHSEVILFTWSSMAVQLAQLMKTQGVHLPIRSIIYGGESFPPKQRETVEAITGARIVTLYGASDMGRLGFSCEHGQLHINEEWAYMEIVDAQGTPLPYGSLGRIVVTLFDNPVMPFIRYDSGDVGMLSDEPCPCGRTLRTLELYGRQMHLITFPDGRTISLLDVVNAFVGSEALVHHYQIIRTAEYKFTIKVVPWENFYTEQERLSSAVQAAIHPDAEITWEFVDSVPSTVTGKAIPYVSQIRD